MNKLLPFLLLLLLAGVGGYYFLNHQKSTSPSPIPLPQGGVCEAETMMCSDGTILKKEGPNCDFPPCPNSGSTSTSSGVINDSIAPSALGEEITVTGVMVCLPVKNPSGPQTMECALGMRADNGNNFALNDPGWKYLIGVGNGTKITVVGKLSKPAPGSKYDTAGTIEIKTLSKL